MGREPVAFYARLVECQHSEIVSLESCVAAAASMRRFVCCTRDAGQLLISTRFREFVASSIWAWGGGGAVVVAMLCCEARWHFYVGAVPLLCNGRSARLAVSPESWYLCGWLVSVRVYCLLLSRAGVAMPSLVCSVPGHRAAGAWLTSSWGRRPHSWGAGLILAAMACIALWSFGLCWLFCGVGVACTFRASIAVQRRLAQGAWSFACCCFRVVGSGPKG